ncbi:MAG: acyl-CoA thioesterase [Bacillota bacterium]
MNFSESKIRVRYAETDQMGVVYHANYYIWFEVARADFLRKFGMTYKDMEKQGVVMPVIETSCRYKLPAMYDDMLTVKAVIKELGLARMVFHYRVTRDEDGQLLAEGETHHAFTNSEKKPVNMKKVKPELYELFKRIT